MLFYIVSVVIIIVVVYILLLTIPFVNHKSVNKHVKNTFYASDCYSDYTGSERVMPILDYEMSMEINLRILNEAKERIIISTYKVMSDDAGKDFMAAVIEAADRGVKVEFIVNGINEFLNLRENKYIQAFARQENISMYIYNKVSLLKPWKIQAALHSKYVIVDNTFYTMGGRNIFNLFMGDYGDYHNKDSEALVYEEGDIEGTSFEELLDYHKATRKLKDVVKYNIRPDSEEIAKACVELIVRRNYLREKYPKVYKSFNWHDNTYATNKLTLLTTSVEAINKEPILWFKLGELAKSGKDVSIYTPYIINGNEMYKDLYDLVENTDRVQIVTNAVINGANPFGCSDYMNQKRKILDTGVELYEYSGEFSTHMKAYVIDNRMTVLGSSNMDMRSVYLDTELMLAIDSKDINEIVKDDFKKTLTYCSKVTKDGVDFYNENYIHKEMKPVKRIIYQCMRVIVRGTRRFL
ncbi:MAG: phospholipase D-like domain-containing protein [Suipraeoptans sp.]